MAIETDLSVLLNQVSLDIADSLQYSPLASRKIRQYLAWINLALEAEQREDFATQAENLHLASAQRKVLIQKFGIDPQSLLPPGLNL